MKYVDEYRDPHLARRMIADIRRRATRRWTIMEVCGGQTHGLLRHGIEEELADVVETIHGPGCPVCVTHADAIDFACELARTPGCALASFGDMLRVPASRGSLLDARAAGGAVRAAYSPLDAVRLAQRDPNLQVVFFAVGFETTAPATALAVRQAAALGLDNFSMLVAHVRVQPAMEAVLASPGNRVQAFLAAGHVCAVMGCESYASLAERYRAPIVVTGFEPLDLLAGMAACVRQLEAGEAHVENRYARSVRPAGNPAARRLLEETFEACDRPWRGMGVVAAGGLRLRDEYRRFDAEFRFRRPASAVALPAVDANDCLAGEVLAGRLKPTACPHFGSACTPETPRGAPMVSSEGACAAYFRYRRPAAAVAGEEVAR